jgi:adenylate cyclase
MSEGTQRRLAAIVAVDVAGYSRLMGADEDGTLAALKAHREAVTPIVQGHGGRIVGTSGDGLLLEFPSVTEAVLCALGLQPVMAERNADVPEDRKMLYRIGINLGDVMIDGEDIYGDGINVAARLETLAQPGGVALSDDVYRQVRDRIDVDWVDGGEHEVKNIARPIQVWHWSPAGQSDEPAATVVEDGATLSLPDKPSIVVLPFDNMSGDPEQEYFADGITEDITTDLSRFHDLFVIARNTAFAYKKQTPNVVDVARELGVHFVLEGSVRRAGSQVRINTQLIDGQSGSHVWAERYDGSVDKIFDLQDEVTRQVVNAIGPNIKEAELARMRRGECVFDEAHDLAWKALDQLEQVNWASRTTEADVARSATAAAIEKAYRAIALNKHCHLAYFVMCSGYFRELLMQWTDDRAATQRQLKEAADIYVSLAPRSHRSHYCCGIAKMLSDRPQDSAENLRHSVELNPNDAMVHGMLAYVEVQLGEFEAAKTSAQKSIRLDPKDSWAGPAYLALAQAAFAEDDPQFRHWAEKAIRAQPSAPIRRALMIAHAAETGDMELLREHYDHLNGIAPRFIPSILEGENDPIKVPAHREKFLAALRKAADSVRTMS